MSTDTAAQTVTLRPGQAVYSDDAIEHAKRAAVEAHLFAGIDWGMVSALGDVTAYSDAQLMKNLGAMRRLVGTELTEVGAADIERAIGRLYVEAMRRHLFTIEG